MTTIESPDDVAAWLDGLIGYGAPRGVEALDLMSALVDRLGHPHRVAPAVHVVGTAGKGTVVSVLTARLVASGLRVATHQSPHVYDLRERFMLDGELPAWPAVVDAAASVARAAADVARERGRPPSFFAATAALSWELGRRAGSDLFVTEAGIGARVDATAVLDRPDTLTIVTAIGLDHTDVLGETVEEITTEKCAVLRGRTDVVLGPQPDRRVAALVRETAAGFDCTIHEVTAPGADWVDVAHATVDVALGILADRHGITVTSLAEPVVVAGRREVVWLGDRRLVLDGAHNPMKLEALRRSLASDPPSAVVAAFGAAKDLEACAIGLASFGAPVIVVEFGEADGIGPKSWPAAAVVAAVRGVGGEAEVAGSIDAAVAEARERTRPGDAVLVTGSFMHLAGVRDGFAATRG